MMPDKVLYSDGHDVTVTDSVLKVKNTVYKINGITKHALFKLKPQRFPSFFLLILGAILTICGVLQQISPNLIPDMRFNETIVTANTLAVAAGLFLMLVGIIVIAVMHDRYAVRIATAEGEKNVVVSRHKEYVQQIVNALSEAFNFRTAH
jgi:hypothetical protein